jgi:hypothetical protein
MYCHMRQLRTTQSWPPQLPSNPNHYHNAILQCVSASERLPEERTGEAEPYTALEEHRSTLAVSTVLILIQPTD